MPDQQDQRHAHHQVHQRDQREHGGVRDRRDGDQLALQGQFGHRDGGGLRRILQHHDHDVAVGRQHDLHGLRQHHAPHRRAPAHAHRHGGFDLASVDGLDAGAEVFGLIGGIRHAQADDGRLHGPAR
ncbi:hypothetical protein G6F68_017146 [Rhizopus microsporus]|nr:hypothetical protein G6F68_017146 [Rhizopus microsporus]